MGGRPAVVLDVFALATGTDDANRPTILSVGGAFLTSKRAGASRLRWIQPSPPPLRSPYGFKTFVRQLQTPSFQKSHPAWESQSSSHGAGEASKAAAIGKDITKLRDIAVRDLFLRGGCGPPGVLLSRFSCRQERTGGGRMPGATPVHLR